MNENMDTKVEKLRPFTRFCITIGELPSSYLMSMTYYEQILWFTKYLQETVIPAINNNATAVEEIQNFLKTLDLQDEVNNKLDEMAESGELQEIMAAYLNTKAIFGFDNVASMKEATNLIDGSYAETLGFNAKNDGGKGLYKIRKITNDDVVNDMNIIPLSDDTLIAELIINDELNINQVGIFGDNETNLTSKLQFVFDNYNKIFIPDGIYLHDNVLVVNSNTLIHGEQSSVLYSNNPVTSSIEIYNADNVEFKNLTLESNATTRLNGEHQVGLLIKNSSNINVHNIIVNGSPTSGIYTINSTNVKIYNNIVKNTMADGIHTTGNSKNVQILNNRTFNIGDDFIAVVSYQGDSDYVENVEIIGNIVNDGRARGISVVGGKKVTIDSNTIYNTDYSSIYINQENNLTKESSDIIITNNNTYDSHVNGTSTRGAIFISTDQGTYNTHNIIFANNIVKNCKNTGVDLIRVNNVKLINNIIEDVKKSTINIQLSNNVDINNNNLTMDSTVTTTGLNNIDINKSTKINLLDNTITHSTSHGINLNGDGTTPSNGIKVCNNKFIDLNHINTANRNVIHSNYVNNLIITNNYVKCTNSMGTYISLPSTDSGEIFIDNNNNDSTTFTNGEFIIQANVIKQQNPKKVQYKTAIPSDGTYTRGDIVYNINPSADDYIGWVCVTSGTPGTWKTFGQISS